MEKNIRNKISNFKWFLTLAMVLYHSRATYGYNLVYGLFLDNKILDMFLRFCTHLGTLSMVFFFFISGFLLYNKADNIKEILKKMKNRIKTLMIPFIIWSFITMIYKYFESGLDFSFYNMCNYLFFDPIAGPLWYILALLLLMLIAPLFISLKKNKKINIFLLSTISIVCLLRNFNIINPILNYSRWWWYGNTFYYMPVYLLGAYIGMYHPSIILKRKYDSKKCLITGGILLFISALLWLKFDNSLFHLFYSIIEIIGLWLIMNPKLFKKKTPNIYASSFFVYALHGPILIPIFHNLLTQAINNTPISGIVIILMKFVQLLGIIIISYILYLLINKILPKKISSLFTGGR